ncbi:hypothetical protein [Gudongella sp. SC589]|jgi:hypothetical protein|uniref:hypothetical protein n=1 Tax=Gudongella sp. SC589 TaxID=3385990 RepID=UPI0039049FDA
MKKHVKYIFVAAVIVLTMLWIIEFRYGQTYYDFPLTRTSVENALKEASLDWEIIKEDSLDVGNSFFTLSNSEYPQKIDIASMSKDDMLSFAIMPRDSISHEYIIFDDVTRKQLLHLTCELTGIGENGSIYSKFSKYIEDRDSRKYGPATWYYKSKDEILEISMIQSSAHPNKYQISSIQVKNIAFFEEGRKIFANYTTQSLKKQGVPVYTYIPLDDIESYISKDKESISRIVIVGRLSNIKKPGAGELEAFNFNDPDYEIYPDEYRFAQISDDSGTIKVIIPAYIVDLSLRADKKREWHINYHPSSDIYVVDYGI